MEGKSINKYTGTPTLTHGLRKASSHIVITDFNA